MSSPITTSIIKKWRTQRDFIRFLDGNIQNCAISNLQYVSIVDAMEHIHDWKVDWDLYLTKKEKKLVMDPSWRSGLVFK
ncbi:hypothetical protein EhVM1_000085 [Emiliania huxleyi virus M1]|nr:hypothetical protein EhVM1_000085 [Emiliania huxleyi virus M1]